MNSRPQLRFEEFARHQAPEVLSHPDWIRYRKDYLDYFSSYENSGEPEEFPEITFLPCLNENTPTTELDKHYFYQNTWASRKIFQQKPDSVLDIGSTALYAGIISQFVPTVFLDIRPPEVHLPGLTVVGGSCLELPFADRSQRFVTSLCVLEHIGLGRYGDALLPGGTRLACREIDRIIQPGGQLIVSTNVGPPCIVFNAHRVFSKSGFLSYFPGYELLDEIYLGPEPVAPERLQFMRAGQYVVYVAHLKKGERLSSPPPVPPDRAQPAQTVRPARIAATEAERAPVQLQPETRPVRVGRIERPAVSVIVPTYNRPEQLAETIASILGQTFRDFEIIVVNDAGTDVAPLIDRFGAPGKIVYIRHETNRGLAAARNTGIRAAAGKYIAYLDDDDLFYPQHLEMLVTFLEATRFQAAYTDAYRVHREMRDGKLTVTGKDLPYSFDFDYDRILVENFIPVLCFVHERSCFEDTGMFDESLKVLEDWDLWIRMSRKYKFAHIKKATCEFSWRQDGSTMSSAKHLDFVRASEIIYNKYAEHVIDKPHIRQAQSNRMRKLGELVRPLLDGK